LKLVAGRHASGAVGRARYLRREMTRPEQKLWALLPKRKLNVRRPAPVGRYVVDFVSHAARVVIELDGPLHQTPDVNLRDAERAGWLRSQGYRVLRFPNAEVLAEPTGVADRIEVAITNKALPLDGGGLGGGVAAEMPEWMRSAPNELLHAPPARTPPNPGLPPSRGKGED
jgi:very-short-patch-repair endonuclease